MPRSQQKHVGAQHGARIPIRRQDNMPAGTIGPPGAPGAPGAGGVWGAITGTLSDQTDLDTALAGKAALVHTHAEADVTGLVADLALKAPLASPALTGVPTAPTAAPGTNTTQLATTAYTRAEIAALIASSPATLDTLNELALALGSDPNFSATMATALGLKAPLASPTFTGVPAGPTAAPGTNTTQLATTAFALAEAALKSGATATSTITTTGTQTALAIPAGTGDLIIRANNATLLTIQGIVAGIDGQRLIIESVGAGQVDFAHQDAGATAANRLINFATVGQTSLAAGSGIAVFVYDGTTARWRLVAHEQGAFIDVPFSAGNFTGSGAMTWTVDSGDQVSFAYLLMGSALLIVFTLKTTTIGGTPDIALQMALPGGYAARLKVGTMFPYLNGGVPGNGVMEVLANATTLQLYSNYAAATWAAAVNDQYLEGSITLQAK